MIVRDAKISDAGALSEIYKYYVDHFPYSFEYDAPSAAEFGKRISDISGKFPFFICENNGEVVGFTYAHLFKERKAYQWYAKHPFTQSTDAHEKALVPCCMQNCFPQSNSRVLLKRMRFLAVPMKAARYFTKKWDFRWRLRCPMWAISLVRGTISSTILSSSMPFGMICRSLWSIGRLGRNRMGNAAGEFVASLCAKA